MGNEINREEITLKGIPASPGIAMGPAFLIETEEPAVHRRQISDEEIPNEISRFEDALIQTRKEILEIQKKISEEMSSEHAEIFNAHLLVLEDKMFLEEVISRLRKEKFTVEYILVDVIKKYIKVFSRMDDEYLKERISDIDDVGKRILRHLIGQQRQDLTKLKEKVIVVAYNLSPSDTALMHKESVLGFVTDIGGRTSHTAIMAKSLEIPAVVGLEKVSRWVKNGDYLIVNGNEGIVIINPREETLKKYQEELLRFEEFTRRLEGLRDLPAETLDGYRVKIVANIESPQEIPSVLAHGAFGIGLYRTEYFYMNRKDLPSEEEQYAAYRRVAIQMAPHSVTIRTLDLGGDKFVSQLDIPYEINPFMGWRAIRFCLARPDIFKTQLSAILRASLDGKLRLMYPLISGIEELQQANRILREVKEDLRKRNICFDENLEVGAMIEVPSAAMISDILAKEVDFFSIGTNDLIQYSLAVDRVNEKIAYLYEPAHPAILRIIKNIIDSAHSEGIWVGMCGEMAGEVLFIPLLLGLGLDEFSVSPVTVPEIKQVIRSMTISQAKEIARECLTFSTSEEILKFLRLKLKEIVPEVIV
ncbi:MAG: phosphoenolpyruvate--protein phosphotransferase [Candidatus Omnitrophica bacterium]|nr:phosphoenolpyruvate--protein phosphotransferase [Candidatus Omnitrophota bacterium]MCM8793163.1 phosphoenolpyruvate--protein phosphotransferase [Candidatus Omnitrophota bacterium]